MSCQLLALFSPARCSCWGFTLYHLYLLHGDIFRGSGSIQKWSIAILFYRAFCVCLCTDAANICDRPVREVRGAAQVKVGWACQACYVVWDNQRTVWTRKEWECVRERYMLSESALCLWMAPMARLLTSNLLHSTFVCLFACVFTTYLHLRRRDCKVKPIFMRSE